MTSISFLSPSTEKMNFHKVFLVIIIVKLFYMGDLVI